MQAQKPTPRAAIGVRIAVTFAMALVSVPGITSNAMAQERYVDSLFGKIRVRHRTYYDTLKLDIYTPQRDLVKNRPLIILVHGGGFASGKRDNPLESRFCTQLAQKGYVVTSIDYRLTRKGKSFGCDCPANEKIKTFRAAVADLLLAAQYLMDKANRFDIDPEKIVLVGSSAGAEAVLNAVFMRNHYAFRDFKYGNLQFTGIVSFAGAVLDDRYLTLETAVPTLMFHGEADNLVPFGTAPHHFCEEDAPGYLFLSGPKAISDKLGELGVPYVLYQDPEGDHDWANLPYYRTDSVARFINDQVLKGEFVQRTKEISHATVSPQ